MPLEALIFDVDGTLADTERQGHRVAFNQAFAEAGLDWNWDEDLYGELLHVAGGTERMRYFIERYRPTLPAHCPDLDGFLARLQDIKSRRYVELTARREIVPRPGVVRLLREARAANFRLAIATTTTSRNVAALLDSAFPAGAAEWFEVIGAGDIISRKKPAPDVYRHVLDELGLPAERCLAFEDSDNGLRAAHGAGLPTLITVNAYTRDQDFRGAELVVDQLGEASSPLTVLDDLLYVAPGATIDVPLLERLHRSWRARSTLH
jgi:HAD superfamily hydrolase (TIGR01509 family)